MRSVVLAVSALTLAFAVQAADTPAGFDASFLDRTMRVDYLHVGNATDELVTLDRVYEQGIWAGSRTHLVDPFEVGRYRVRVFDAASKALLFSRCFDSYFGEYRTTTGAEKGVRRTYHESALIPYPKKSVRFAVEVRGKDRAWKEIGAFDIDPSAWTVVRKRLEPGVTVIKTWESGNPHAKVDIAILAEGYTAGEEAKLRADLARFTANLVRAEPYAGLKDRFNVHGVWKPSDESGCDEPSYGSYRRTSVGASFDSLGTERYVLIEDNRTMRDLAAHVPYDTIIAMINTARYGGGGIYNAFCTFTTDNQWSEYTFLHEFGHSFAGLADEYYTSSVAYNEFYPKGVEPNEANITALLDPAKLKWKELVSPGTAIPTPWEKAEYDARDRAYQKLRGEVDAKIAKAKREGAPKPEVVALQEEGERLSREHQEKMDAYLAASKFIGVVGAFEGAGYAAQGLYRPMLDCLMFSKGAKPLCSVCQAHVSRVIEHYSE